MSANANYRIINLSNRYNSEQPYIKLPSENHLELNSI